MNQKIKDITQAVNYFLLVIFPINLSFIIFLYANRYFKIFDGINFLKTSFIILVFLQIIVSFIVYNRIRPKYSIAQYFLIILLISLILYILVFVWTFFDFFR